MIVCLTLLILYGFMDFQSECLQVFGPDVPLGATAGKDLVLPCFTKPSNSIVDMTVEWRRLDVEKQLVHLYLDHEDKNEDQAQSYRERTSLFKEELQKGNASLKLSSLRVSDEGEYRCFIEDKTQSDSITMYVTVEAVRSNPVITMESYSNSGGINLVCESKGWKVKPEVVWLDREGVTLPAEDPQVHVDTEGFSVKRHITIYDYSESNRIYCRFQQEHHMMETDIIINSKLFGSWKWLVGISVLSFLIAVGWIISAFILHKKEEQRQKVEHELQRLNEEQDLAKMKKFAVQQRLNVEEDLAKMKEFAVDVTLDPDTANRYLILTADGKQVTHGDRRKDLPYTPQRFTHNYDRCVVGNQSFSSRRFYYEVQVSGKTKWRLGVVRENINRKDVRFRPQAGVWTVGLYNENQYEANAGPDVLLTLREKVETVGVFVDYDEGLVSFYDVKSRCHIYSYTGLTFTDKLYPFFYTGDNYGGKNSAPLIITPVTNTE